MQDRLRIASTGSRASLRFLAGALFAAIVGSSLACPGPDPDEVPAGQLALSLVWVAWDEPSSAADPDRDVFSLRMELRNGVESAPAPLNPALFSMSTSGGVEVVGMPSSFLGTSPCESDISVLAGSSRECSLAFRIPPSELPLELIYRAVEQDREARAAIPACGPDTPVGLCELGRICVEGACVTPCSAEHPDGLCLIEGEICTRDGSCELGCSEENPSGPCADGTCIDGECDESVCWSGSLGEGCILCLQNQSATCEPASAAPGCHPETLVEQCVQCPLFSDDTTCGCLDYSNACQQCAEGAEDRAWFLEYWSCLARECPMCL